MNHNLQESKRKQLSLHAEIVLLHRSIMVVALFSLGIDHKSAVTFFVAQWSALISQTCASMYPMVLTETSQVTGTNGKLKHIGGIYC